MQIQIDITGVAHDERFNPGNKLSDLHNIGIVPDEIDGGRSLHVSNWNGSRVVVRDYQTDELIVSGNGWGNAMQALADHYGVPVQVSRDFGVRGGKSGKVLGFWSPATPADAPVAPAPRVRKLSKAEAHSLRQIVEHPTLTSYRPGREYPSYDRTKFSFNRFDMVLRRTVRCTDSVNALVDLGLAEIPDPERGCRVTATEAGLTWVAAHPA